MATLLIATTEGGVVRRVPLDPRRAYSIGRSQRCDIPLEPGSISRRHALLFRHAGTWWVADSGSHRGLRSEDGATRFAVLTAERWVGLGPLVLWLLEGSRERPASDDESDRQTDRQTDRALDSLPGDPGDSVETDAIEPGEPSDLILIESTAGTAARLVSLAGVDHATIGTDQGCAICLAIPASEESSSVAPLHAVFFREPSAWVVIAATGAVMSKGERYLRKRLSDGETIELGTCRIRLMTAEVLDPEHDGRATLLVRAAQRPTDPHAPVRPTDDSNETPAHTPTSPTKTQGNSVFLPPVGQPRSFKARSSGSQSGMGPLL